MRLTEEQLSVIKEARALLAGADYSHHKYICWCIAEVLDRWVKVGVVTRLHSLLLNDQLCSAIQAGIGDMLTFSFFMLDACPPLLEMYLQKNDRDNRYENAIMMARVAWLDWIIETGEITPENLPGSER
jgi:hypothetical protein